VLLPRGFATLAQARVREGKSRWYAHWLCELLPPR
jgi:hypothetical protein